MRMSAVLLTGVIFASLLPARVYAQGDGAPAAFNDLPAKTQAQAEASAPVTPPTDVAVAQAPSAASGSESASAPSPAVDPAPATGIAVTLARVPDAEDEGAEAPAPEEDPMICRTQVETGTIGRRNKICMTKSQWAAHTRATRKWVGAMQRSRSTQPGGEALGASSGSPGSGRPGG